MPQDDQDQKDRAPPAPPATPVAPVTAAVTLGRTFRGEVSPPIATAEGAADRAARATKHASEPGAVPIHVYFVSRGVDNPIQQASMLAYTDIRSAPPEVFDDVFADHHQVPSPKAPEETKRP